MMLSVNPGIAKWRDLVLNLVSKEVKLRHMGAALGFIWSLGNPLVVTLTYYVVFTYILPSNQDRFALHLVTGVVHWMLFNQILSQSCEWLVNNGSLIRKIRFPRILMPLAGALTVFVFWGVAMGVYVVLFGLLGGVVTSALVWYPVVLISFVALIIGAGLVLSVLQVVVRDTKHFVDMFLPLLFWFTPIVWMTSSLPEGIQQIVAFNPIAPYFNSFAAILHDGVVPSTSDLATCIGLGFISMAIGLLAFKKVDTVVDHL